MLANDILQTVGNTPHIRINRLFGSAHSVYVKSERSNRRFDQGPHRRRMSSPPKAAGG
jgi:hypothetical protein